MKKFWRKEQNTTVKKKPANTTSEQREAVATNEVRDTANEAEPEERLVHEKSPRMHSWVALTASSTICLCSIVKPGNNSSAESWVLIVSCVSLAVSFLTSVAYSIRRLADKFVDKIYEGIIAFLVLFFWIGGLPVIMDPSRGIAVTTAGELGLNFVTNPNLYFFSWGSFVCIIYICASYVKARIPEAKDASYYIRHTPKHARWFILVCASIVVLAAAGNYQKSLDCGSNKGETCKTNAYAASLGAVAMVIALGVNVGMFFGTLNVWTEIVTVVIVLGLYTAGVALVTFDDGSGTSIGNLYFSIWIGFLVTVFLFVDAYKTLMALWATKRATKKAAQRATTKAAQPEAKGEADEIGRRKEAEVDSDIDENEFYEAKDEESKHFKYISNV